MCFSLIDQTLDLEWASGRMDWRASRRRWDHVLPGRSQKRYWIIQTDGRRCTTTTTTTKKEVDGGKEGGRKEKTGREERGRAGARGSRRGDEKSSGSSSL